MSTATPTGYVPSFYAVDVAEAVNLPALDDLLDGTTRATPLMPRSTAPAYLPYQRAPMVVDADAINIPDAEGVRARFKVCDYGVVPVALRREFSGDWADVVRLAADLISDDAVGRTPSHEVRCSSSRSCGFWCSSWRWCSWACLRKREQEKGQCSRA